MSDYNRYFPLRVVSEGERGLLLRDCSESRKRKSTQQCISVEKEKHLRAYRSRLARASTLALVQRRVPRFDFSSLRSDLRHTFDRLILEYIMHSVSFHYQLVKSESGMTDVPFSLCLLPLFLSCTRHARGPRDLCHLAARFVARM